MITVTSVEAQNRFGQLLDTVQREPVTITRHGRTVAVMVRPEDRPLQGAAYAQESARQVGLNAIAAFRGAGRQGSTAQLRQDREADRLRELRKDNRTSTTPPGAS